MLYYIFFFIILMNLIIKQLCIIIGVFSITLWVQDMDDKKYNKIRTDVYDKYKFPLLISAIIGFLINIPEIIMKSNTNNEIPLSFINNIRSPSSTMPNLPNAQMANSTRHTLDILPFVKRVSIDKPTEIPSRGVNLGKSLGEQQIYTSLPDF
jgi:hypothetical protein